MLGARRLASSASRPAGILLLDSSPGQGAEAVHTQALDLALRRAGFRVLLLSSELADERLERAVGALEPTAILLCGPGSSPAGAVRVLRRVRELGVDAPLYGFRAGPLSEGADGIVPAGDTPSQVTGMLNSDLRRRAVAPSPSDASRPSAEQQRQLAALRQQPAICAPQLAVLIEEAVTRQAGAEDAQVPVAGLAARRWEWRAEVDGQVEGGRRMGRSRTMKAVGIQASRIAAASGGSSARGSRLRIQPPVTRLLGAMKGRTDRYRGLVVVEKGG